MTAAIAVARDRVRSGATRDRAQRTSSLFFVGLLLFVFTLVLNIVRERFVRKYRRPY